MHSTPTVLNDRYDGDHELVRGGYRQVVQRLHDGYTQPAEVAQLTQPPQPFEGVLKDVRLNHTVQWRVRCPSHTYFAYLQVTNVTLNKSGTGVKVTTKDHGAYTADAVSRYALN